MKPQFPLRKPVTIRLLLFLLVSVASAAAQLAPLTVKFIDVGQADAILIICPNPSHNHHLLIDTGDSPAAIRYPGSSAAFKQNMEAEFSDKPRVITTVVASHPHSDHIGNMQWVLETFEVGTYVDNGQKTDGSSFGKLEKLRVQLVKNGKLNYVNGKQNSFGHVDFCPLCDLEIFEPWAKNAALSDPNNRSVGARLTYKDTSFLFVGDMEKEAEGVMLNDFTEAERNDLRANVLKVGHHGSDTSSTDKFIHHVAPGLVIVSCGKKEVGTNRQYKHPRLSTVREYFDWFTEKPPPASAPVPKHDKVWAYDKDASHWRQQSRPQAMWITPNDGSITLHSDGEKIDIKTEK
jgi:competence protein ComEC